MSEGCIIVTGANSGIGLDVARIFYKNGRDLVITCRSKEKADSAIENIKNTSSNENGSITYLILDLSDYTSVHNFVKEFHELDKKLQILVNNAGVTFAMKDKHTKHLNTDGYELTAATNHIGHFLLTNLLLEDLKSAYNLYGDARIITLASCTHDYDKVNTGSKPFDIDNMFLTEENTYNGWQAYVNSKYMNVLFTYALSRRLGHETVKTNCLCPGLIPTTGLFKDTSFFMKAIFKLLWLGTGKVTTQIAASHIYDMAVSEKSKGITGKYFVNGEITESQKDTYNEELQDKLWSITEELLREKGYLEKCVLF